MSTATIAGARGLGLYLALCLVSAVAGRGLLRLLQARLEDRVEPVLGSVLTFALWSLVLGLTSAFRCPVKYVTPCLWAASALLAGHGLRRPWPALRTAWLPWAVCVVLPVAVMSQAFLAGITDWVGTADIDGWAYAAQGHHYWEYGRGAQGCLPPVDQYGATLGKVRYMAATLLGFLSPLSHAGDTLAVEALLQAFALFTVGCAVSAFCAGDRFPPGVGLAITAATVLSGWVSNLIWANNLDNTLALVYMPSLAGVVGLWEARDWRRWLVLGLLLADLLYTYPEGASVICGGAGLILLPRLWEERGLWRAWLCGGGLALAGGVLLWLPVAPVLVGMVRDQLAGSLARPPGTRPGDPWFAGLLEPRYQPACFWALGGECAGKPYHDGMRALAVLLTVVLAVGLVLLARQRRWGLALAAVVLPGGAFFVLFHYRYEYAAYKLFVVGWWCVAAATVTGVHGLTRLVPRTGGRGLLAGELAVAALALGVLVTRTTAHLAPSPYHAVPGSAFRFVRDVRRVTGGQGLLVAVEDGLPSLYAVFYLREQPIYLACPRGFLGEPWHVENLRRGRLAPLEDVKYVLTDDGWGSEANAALRALCRPGRPAGARGPYRLWELDPGDAGADIVFVFNPGTWVQRDARGSFFWMGREETVVYLVAARVGAAELTAEFAAGPNRPGQGASRLAVATDAGRRREVTVPDGRATVTVPVHAGVNRITLSALDPPAVPPAPGAEPLLLGVWNLRAGLGGVAPAAARGPSAAGPTRPSKGA